MEKATIIEAANISADVYMSEDLLLRGLRGSFRLGFERGVEWYVGAIWHDAKVEKPKFDKCVILEFGNGVRVIGQYKKWGYSYFSKEPLRGESVVKWAYFEDLLPPQPK